jgi:(2Fe-2S) ferredoxin
MEIHRDKRKGVLGLSQEGILRKVVKKYCMHACKSTPVPIVKGNGFGNFYVPRVNMKWIKEIWYHMLQLLEA